ncbi:60S ribosomal protein L26-1 [Capsicum chinense]|nr:60S ribosomal protein L26-1 [Capsicum chinense]
MMPLSVFNTLRLEKPRPYFMVLQMADRIREMLEGIIEVVLIKVIVGLWLASIVGGCCDFLTLFYVRINNMWRSQSFRAHAMSTTGRRVMPPKTLLDTEDGPEHLLVLVHGILARFDKYRKLLIDRKAKGRNATDKDKGTKYTSDDTMQIVD